MKATSDMEGEALLRKYNPVLVILPRDWTRHRPGSPWYQKLNVPRGDYHPCAARFFLSFVIQRDEPRPWNPLAFTEGIVPKHTGLSALGARVEEAGRDATLAWELDVAPVKSQDPDQAWTAYAAMLCAGAEHDRVVVHGHYVPGPRAFLLYWYLYVYNDAPNKHEGDWEMVGIELDESGKPTSAGYAGHSSGFRRKWSRVEKQGERPLVYVARGSHAAYFEHRPQGHTTNSLDPRKGWIEPFETFWATFNKVVQVAFRVLRLVDRTPSHPDHPGVDPSNAGELLEPELLVLPSVEDVPQHPEFWWMNLRCRWGSRHSRIMGFIGPNPPWEQGMQWTDPGKWLGSLVDD